MNYIENDGHITREYDVKINDIELERIIKELDEKCSFTVLRNIKVCANNEEEVLEKINANNNSDVKINKLVKVPDKYYLLKDITACPFVFECEYFCKQSSYLASLLRVLLFNYHSSLNFRKQDSRLIDNLVYYQNNDELKPFKDRIANYEEEILNFKHRNNTSYELEYKNQIENKLLETLSMEKYNVDYDFELLADLYKQAKECFELVLVSETVHYKDLDHCPKVYKLGEKKSL